MGLYSPMITSNNPKFDSYRTNRRPFVRRSGPMGLYSLIVCSNGLKFGRFVRCPSLVRVFRMKVQRLLWDIRHGNCFGRFVANVWAIEYQKRGLPHVHILIFLHSEDRERLLIPDNIDRIISISLTAETLRFLATGGRANNNYKK